MSKQHNLVNNFGRMLGDPVMRQVYDSIRGAVLLYQRDAGPPSYVAKLELRCEGATVTIAWDRPAGAVEVFPADEGGA